MAKRVTLALALTLALVPAVSLAAQNADSMFTLRANDALNRIRRYTTSDVAMARTIADSLVRALPAEATVMPEALFAKASIAPSAADAEKDYSRIVNEYRFAPKVPDALMRLALLEGARSNRAGSLRHLDRLLRDHGESAVRSRASLMAGRLRLEMNDPARGCELLAAAWASAGLNERDVKDQAESLGAKCPSSIVDRAQRDPAPMGILRAAREPSTAIVSAPQTADGRRRQRESVPSRPPEPRRDSAPTSVLVAQGVRTPITPTPRDSVVPSRRDVPAAVVRRDSVAAPVVRRDTVIAQRVSPTLPSVRRDTTPTPRTPTPLPVVRRDTAPTPRLQALEGPVVRTAPARTAAPVPTAAVSISAAATRYAVQFAAYNDRPGAEQFAQQLQQRGIAARVEGSDKPFRVRAGRFSTRAEAEAQMVMWRKPGQAAIVVSYP